MSGSFSISKDASFSSEAFLEGYAGPAFTLDDGGRVLAANARGANLVSLVEQGGVPEIPALVDTARTENKVASGVLTLAGSKGEIVIEAMVVPQPDGKSFLVLGRDISMERNLRSALVESRQRYKDLVEVSSDFAWEVGEAGTFAFVSPGGALGYKAEELTDQAPADYVINPEEYSPLPFLSEHPRASIEVWMRRKDGKQACVVASCLPLFDEDGNWAGARGVCRDVTEEREREAALLRARHREQVLSYIVNTIRDELDPNNTLNVAAATVARALGATGSAIFRPDSGEENGYEVCANFGDKVDMNETCAALLSRLEKQGDVIEVEAGEWQVLIAATRYHQPINGTICIWRRGVDGGWGDDDFILIGDVANQVGIVIEQVANHERILKLSRTDGLTGLLNRRAFFEEELPRRIRRMEGGGDHRAALFYVDMDNFKLVNDVHGHQIGDEAIIFLRDMLIQNTRPQDVIARLGGDEFAIWFDDVSVEVAHKRAQGFLDAAQGMKKYSGADDAPLGISIGVTFFDPAGDESLDDAIARADQAMYAVKRRGKGGYEIVGEGIGQDIGQDIDKGAAS